MALGEAQTIDEIVTQSHELAAAVIKRLEQADIFATPSPGALRAKVYDTLAGFGIDVSRLVQDQHGKTLQRARARIRHARLLNTMTERKLESGELTRSERVEAKARLAAAPRKIASYRAVIDKIISRPKYFNTAPTPERRAKEHADPKVIHTVPHAGASSPKSYRFEGVVEQAGYLSAQESEAVERFRTAWQDRTARPSTSKTAYGLSGGFTRASDRLGLTPKQQDAARLWRYFEQKIAPPLLHSCQALLLKDPDTDAAVEWGRRYIRVGDKRRGRGAYEGTLRTLAQMLQWYLAGYDRWRAAEQAARNAQRMNDNRR